MTRSRLLVLILPFALLALTACGEKSDRLPTVPVRGKLLNPDGKPVENASIVLHSDDPKLVASRPHGKTGPDGSFTLTTYDTDDGAPVGNYRVTVEQWLAGRPDEGPSNRLPAKLGKPETSGLTVTVTAGQTELEAIRLKK